MRRSQPLWRLVRAVERSANRRRGSDGDRWAWRGEADPRLRAGFPPLPPRRYSGTAREDLLSQLERGVFEHLGRAVELGSPDPDWRLGEREDERLWTVTLHYHGWAAALAEAAAGGGAAGERRRASSAATLATGSNECVWNGVARSSWPGTLMPWPVASDGGCAPTYGPAASCSTRARLRLGTPA